MAALWLLQGSSQSGTSPAPDVCSAFPILMRLRLTVGPAFNALILPDHVPPSTASHGMSLQGSGCHGQ
eukprot:1680012-Karenia_brevis.AAC.1